MNDAAKLEPGPGDSAGRGLRDWIEQSLVLARVGSAGARHVERTLHVAEALALQGVPLPPLGILADLLTLADDPDALWAEVGGRASAYARFLPGSVRRTYEDDLLGRFVSDARFRRAAEALRQPEVGERRQGGEGRQRAEAVLMQRILQRLAPYRAAPQPGRPLPTQFDVSGALLRRLRRSQTEDELTRRGWQTLAAGGLHPEIANQYRQWARAARHCERILDQADLVELEAGWGSLDPAVRMALRQVLRAEAIFVDALRDVRRTAVRAETSSEVATALPDEDTYPAGGFSSLATRGSIESLLKSQLALLDPEHRPDLFDAKYVRDELLYYCRDENQFRRGRRVIRVGFSARLVRARVKDPGLPFQRLVMALGMLKAVMARSVELLRDEALVFELVFLDDPSALAAERQLVRFLMADGEPGSIVTLREMPEAALCEEARSRPAHLLRLCYGNEDDRMDPSGRLPAGMILDLAQSPPRLGDREVPQEPLKAWRAVAQTLLQQWLASPFQP